MILIWTFLYLQFEIVCVSVFGFSTHALYFGESMCGHNVCNDVWLRVCIAILLAHTLRTIFACVCSACVVTIIELWLCEMLTSSSHGNTDKKGRVRYWILNEAFAFDLVALCEQLIVIRYWHWLRICDVEIGGREVWWTVLGCIKKNN